MSAKQTTAEIQRLAETSSYGGFVASPQKVEGRVADNLFTTPHATSTENTLAGVTDHGAAALVEFRLAFVAREAAVGDVQLGAEMLQLAVAVARTKKTIVRMVCQQ